LSKISYYVFHEHLILPFLQHLHFSLVLVLSSPLPYHECMSTNYTAFFLNLLSFFGGAPDAPTVGASEIGQGYPTFCTHTKATNPMCPGIPSKKFLDLIKDPKIQSLQDWILACTSKDLIQNIPKVPESYTYHPNRTL